MKFGLALAAAAITATVSLGAQAAPVLIAADPVGGTWDAQASARNGRTGFELAIRAPANQNPAAVTYNAPGAPTWVYGFSYDFAFTYTASTGTMTFGVDTNENGVIDTVETLSLMIAGFAGNGFRYMNLLAQGNGVSEADVSDFTVNGTNLGGLASGSGAANMYLGDSTGVFGDTIATGSFVFTANGQTDERPRIWIQIDEAAPLTVNVPEPATLALFGAGLAGLLAARRRRRA